MEYQKIQIKEYCNKNNC